MRPIPIGCRSDTTTSIVDGSERRSVSAPVDLVPHVDDIVAALLPVVKPGDVVITLGAGSIGTVPDRLVEALQA